MKIRDMMADKESPRAADAVAEDVPAGLTVKLKREHAAELAKAERDVSWADFVRERGYELTSSGHVVKPK